MKIYSYIHSFFGLMEKSKERVNLILHQSLIRGEGSCHLVK